MKNSKLLYLCLAIIAYIYIGFLLPVLFAVLLGILIGLYIIICLYDTSEKYNELCIKYNLFENIMPFKYNIIIGICQFFGKFHNFLNSKKQIIK